eukprot:COSAG05_NODE_21770_length_269_cov_0.905882_1_plen_40_part_10
MFIIGRLIVHAPVLLEGRRLLYQPVVEVTCLTQIQRVELG